MYAAQSPLRRLDTKPDHYLNGIVYVGQITEP